jgi:hypothetical protein
LGTEHEATFENCFQESMHQKVFTGIQQLYLIGLYDSLPISKVLKIFKKYLDSSLFTRLNNYVSSDPSCIQYSIHWTTFKSKLDRIKLDRCSLELLQLLSNLTLSEENVRTFHIEKNHLSKQHSSEPTLKNTTKMVYKFFASIYQRNVLASVVKYVLLSSFLKKFETTDILHGQRNIFILIYKRLQEIIKECVLTSFNGSNYDNYLLCNSLILIQTQMKQKIHIFKKGASISTILCINKKNFQTLKNYNVKTKKYFNQWMIKLYIKDIRNLVSSNMSLDKVGKLFNLPVSKLCFPYTQATNIQALKNFTSLFPEDEKFWKDTFSKKTPLLETRKKAQDIFVQKKFSNLYDYGTYYLIQDCYLLHSIVLTLFKSYLCDSVNIFLRRNFSQSNLSYQQFFIIEPSKQIKKNLAPKTINHTLYNYIIRQAVTGGLCTSFVHGKIDDTTIINEHLNYIQDPKLSTSNWPNFFRIKQWSQYTKDITTGESKVTEWKKPFQETGKGIITLDIRSLYPSAALKELPVNVPMFYTRFTQEDYAKLYSADTTYWKTLHLKKYCCNARNSSHPKSDIFKLISKPPRFFNEYYALNYYLNKNILPLQNIKILRFQSSFTALGQMFLNKIPVDGFLSYFDCESKKTYIKVIQYQSCFFHGHKNSCFIKNNPKLAQKYQTTLEIKDKICDLLKNFKENFNVFLNSVDIEYVEIWDCDFTNHKIPKTGKDFSPLYTNAYNTDQFLNAIEKGELTGFLVVKNLEIKKNNQNPIMGFIVQKIKYGLQNLSPYTQEQVDFFNTSKRVISVHKSKSFMVISTEYFNWLRKTFGFENEPEIYHALFFQLDDYLKESITLKLKTRSDLKSKIKIETNKEEKQNLEVKAELIKLMLNSCYGFTLCNVTSQKFKSFENFYKLPQYKTVRKKFKRIIKFEDHVYLMEKKKKKSESFQTLLGHVGCYILFHSKIIFFTRLYFVTQFFNPTLAQLLYMDTDSAHFLVKHKNLKDNVDADIRFMFEHEFNQHFEQGGKISGIWVEEGFYECGEYIAEKCYRLYNKSNPIYLTHMKGLNTNFQQQYHNENIDKTKTSFLAFNQFFKSSDFIIFKTHMSKNIFKNYVPNKRYFISATGSIPLKM